MQAFDALATKLLQGVDADMQMLGGSIFIKLIGHSGQFDLPVDRLVGYAEKRAVGHAKAKAVGGDGRGFHVHSDSASLVEPDGQFLMS